MTSDRRADQVPVLALALGAESLLVNQGLKRLFRRPRPTRRGRPPLPGAPPADVVVPVRARQRGGVHGHAADRVGRPAHARRCGGAWPPPSATSRAYVRIHHASDVVAGMATGAVLGLAARRILRRAGNSIDAVESLTTP